MDAATRARLFEPFFTTKGLANASGLGLATAWGLVRQSGGDMRVESEPGEGALFDIYLPRIEPEDAAPANADATSGAPSSIHRDNAERTRAAATALRGTGGVVLVAEDEPVVRNMVKRLLEQSGLTLLVAADGHAALELARSHDGPIDVLLTDVVMPNMGGRELAERLAAERPDLRVIYMSGYAEDESLRAGALGDAVFMQKPFDPAALTKTIHEVMRRPGKADIAFATEADVELHV
jgi:CheY-like chemotaxis protein